MFTIFIRCETFWLDQANGTRLYYYYDAPPQRGPLLVILQGSECRRVSDKYGPLLEQAKGHNLGVLRVEKPGLGPDTPLGECPIAYLQRNTLERRIWDLLSVLGEMRKRPEWDGWLVVLGGSEGAMLAGLTAPLIPETRAVVLISGGGGDTFAEEIDQIVSAQMRQSGAPAAKLEEQSQAFRQLCDQVHREPTTLKEWGSDGKLARNTHLWLSRAEDLAIYRPLLRVDVPILLVHGAQDASTPLHSAQKLEQIFRERGKLNLELRVEEGDGHAPSAQSLQRTLQWAVEQLQGAP